MTARLIALVPAAGGGVRFGATIPKQYASLAGRPLLACTLDRLRDGLDLHGIAVAIAPDDLHYDRLIGVRDGVTVLRSGGPRRADTVRNALQAMAAMCRDDDWILVHDAARPCVPRAALQRLVAQLEHDAAEDPGQQLQRQYGKPDEGDECDEAKRRGRRYAEAW